jgi:hypothetical protein
VATTRPHGTAADEVGGQRDGGDPQGVRGGEEAGHAAGRIQQGQGDPAVRDPVLAEVPLAHLEFEVRALGRVVPDPVAHDLPERAGEPGEAVLAHGAAQLLGVEPAGERAPAPAARHSQPRRRK